MGGGGGGGGGRELDQTPTWAVACVCSIIIIISILLELVLHKIGAWFLKRKKKALYEALDIIKAELMVLGFISLLLTFGQNYIAKICVPIKVGNSMLPCKQDHSDHEEEEGHHRRLLWFEHRFLMDEEAPACKDGYVPLISTHGLHQLHIFIFFLAVFHVFYSAITMMLGRLKIRGWKQWEHETVAEEEDSKFRLTHETSFVRDHTNAWMQNPITFYIISFFRQFFRSVRRADYLTLRHGFINVHLAPGSKFDFQKYIKRSLEDDFKVVVGINPVLWATMAIFLLLNVHGWWVSWVISMVPLVLVLLIGTKLQGIISQMAIEITERHAVVQGIPLVQVSDSYFWFSKPQLVLHLIHFVLFQNAFEITYFLWIWYEFGLRSCFHDDFVLTIVRTILGIAVQVLCSYITLPLYALVTQMGSTMKRSIFDEQTSKALRQWHKKAALNSKKSTNSVHKAFGRAVSSPTESGSVSVGRKTGQGDVEASTTPRAPPQTEMASVDLKDGGDKPPQTNPDPKPDPKPDPNDKGSPHGKDL